MGTCCSKSAGYKHLSRRQKDKSNIILEELVTKASVDFSNPEIQDIQSAVSEMIERIKTGINEHRVFRISRIEPCGSMAEKTAIWKYHIDLKQPYLEFDFLAILQAVWDIEAGCQECFCVNTLQTNLELLTQYYRSLYKSDFEKECMAKDILEKCFTRETNNCLASCGCLEVIYPYQENWEGYTFEPSSTCSETQQGCDKCTVDRPTGTLEVKTSVQIGSFLKNNCSLIFVWTSRAKTLCTRNKWRLPKTEKMDNLIIHIDFLPALELFQSKQQSADVAACSSSGLVLNPTSSEFEHYCFLVPKHCDVCNPRGADGTWRRSGCRAEIDTIVNKMSVKHHKVYQILKHLNERFPFILYNYHLKIAVLHHSSSCFSEGEDFIKCLFKVLGELQHAYKTRQLKSLHSQANLLRIFFSDDRTKLSRDIFSCIKFSRSITAESDLCDQLSTSISEGKEAICSAMSESDSISAFLEKVENWHWRFKYCSFTSASE